MPYTYQYPRPAVTVDIAITCKTTTKHEIMLIQRKHDPFKDAWALPGGFVDEHEPLLDAAKRELLEETSIQGFELEQFRAYGNPGRDPRGHTVSVIFTLKVKSKPQAAAADDAKDLKWFNLHSLPELAFDHKQIIDDLMA